MGATTGIEWCDHTFNPWIGCTRISNGRQPSACDNCYAEALAKRYGWAKWGTGEPRKRTTDANWRKPIAWNKAAAAAGVRRRVFCASLADVFDAEVLQEWRGDLFELIQETPNLDWLLLTKRPQVAKKFFENRPELQARPNVWLGTTVEDQKMADLRIPILLSIPAKVRFLSCEPLLGPVDIENLPSVSGIGRYLDALSSAGAAYSDVPGRIDWVIAGGESGPKARPSHPDWFRSLRDQCQEAGSPFFFKQWGEWSSIYDRDEHDPDWRQCDRIKRETPRGQWLNLAGGQGFHGARVQRMAWTGKKAAGATLDGREHREFPTW